MKRLQSAPTRPDFSRKTFALFFSGRLKPPVCEPAFGFSQNKTHQDNELDKGLGVSAKNLDLERDVTGNASNLSKFLRSLS